jgi:hypothetical protein
MVHGIDPDGFQRELFAASAIFFAIKPHTLNMLHSDASTKSNFPLCAFDVVVRCPTHVALKIVPASDEVVNMIELAELANEVAIEAECRLLIDSLV